MKDIAKLAFVIVGLASAAYASMFFARRVELNSHGPHPLWDALRDARI